MFNCSANECSSATDFCFSSAISTDTTPDRRARPEDRRAVGRKVRQALREWATMYKGRCVNELRGPERAVHVVTGSFLPTQEAPQLRPRRDPRQEGDVAL